MSRQAPLAVADQIGIVELRHNTLDDVVSGGYQLLRPPEEVSLGRVMEIIDGQCDEAAQNMSASPDSPVVKVLAQAWNEVATAQHTMLDGVMLADLLERAKERHEQMYHI